MKRKFFTKIDIFIIFLYISIALMSWKFLVPSSSKKYLYYYSYNEEKEIDLNKNQTLIFNDEYSKWIVKIENGKVYVAESTCPGKFCKKMGKISKIGESIICVPGRKILAIEPKKGEKKEIDAVTF